MSTLELNGKDFATQTSSAEPVLANTVTGGGGVGGILQVKTVQNGAAVTTTSTGLGTSAYEIAGLTTTFTVGATSKILITGMLHLNHISSYTGRCYITYNHSGISETVIKSNINAYGHTISFCQDYTQTTNLQSPCAVNLVFSPATANEITIYTRMMTTHASYASAFNQDVGGSTDSADGGQPISTLTFWELAGSITPALSNTSIDT